MISFIVSASSLRNSGEKMILSVLNFSFTDFVYPTGTVYLMTITVFGLILRTSLMTASTEFVLK